jgi:hypothetical protein
MNNQGNNGGNNRMCFVGQDWGGGCRCSCKDNDDGIFVIPGITVCLQNNKIGINYQRFKMPVCQTERAEL